MELESIEYTKFIGWRVRGYCENLRRKTHVYMISQDLWGYMVVAFF